MADDDKYLGRREQMLPTLTAEQIKRICHLGQRRKVKAGEVLWEVGDAQTSFYVVVSGALEILRPMADHEEQITVHRSGEFSGEINMLSNRRAIVRARVLEDGEFVMLDREHLRTLVQRDSEISEILMRAFILRRMG